MKMNLIKVLALASITYTCLSATVKTKVKAGDSATLHGGVWSATTALSDAEADSEMGVDLAMDLGLDAGRSSAGAASTVSANQGPATLAEYCAGPPKQSKKIGEGTRVKANWEGYGTMYPGKISDVNKDGTYDIKYNDGFTEKNVDPDEVKKRKSKKQGLLAITSSKEVLTRSSAPADDPACKLQEFLAKLQDKLKKLNDMTAEWLSAQRAKIAGANAPPPRPAKIVDVKPAAPAAAPAGNAPAEASEQDKEELEKLKEQLADREKYIKELEKQAEDNNKELQKLNPSVAPTAAPAVSAIDNLIAQYKAKVADRDKRIDELLNLIKEQEQELARLGAGQLSLDEIDAAVKDLEKDVEEAKKKRDELKKNGSLDPELRAVLDEIMKALEKMRGKVDNLLAAEAKAKADREAAERKAEKAAEEAAKKADLEGKDADKAAKEAREKAQKETEEQVRNADLATMKAAQDVEKEMKEAGKGAAKLDTGLHPHGAKWWRYRYEHSHIEALLMIFISFLMLFWSRVCDMVTHRLQLWSLPPGIASASEEDQYEACAAETHGKIYLVWLQYFAEQMMVCILVFLSLWLIAKTSLIELFPVVIKPSEDMRVPHLAEEYRVLAVDICTIFFFAILFYFAIIYSVAERTCFLSSDLQLFGQPSNDNAAQMTGQDSQQSAEEVPIGRSKSKLTRGTTNISAKVMGSCASNVSDYELLKRHFVMHMLNKMQNSEDESDRAIIAKIHDYMDKDLMKFPLWSYLKVSVRMSIEQLFYFGWGMWLPVICTFAAFMLLHRFAHMGYVRIMMIFGSITLGIIAGMGYYTKSIYEEIRKETPPFPGQKKSIHETMQTEFFFLGVLQYSLFFVCYGVARMICQPWMWELHFWPVFSLTIVALVSATLFVYLVAPAIPSFCALQAMPPYVDSENLATMERIARDVKEGCPQTGSPRRSPRGAVV